MHRLAVCLLAAALAVTTGTTSAQDYSTSAPDYPYGNGDRMAPLYEYAQVVRVDPVIARGGQYGSASRNCYRNDSYYTSTNRDGPYDGPYDDRYGDGYGNRYDNRYRSNDPWATDDGYDHRYAQSGPGTQAGRNVATVLGGIVGAALGSKVGGGSARYATAAIGSMVGGMAGRGIYESNQRNRREASVTVCDPVSNDTYRATGDEVVAYDVTYVYGGREYTTRTDYHPGDRIRVRVDVQAE